LTDKFEALQAKPDKCIPPELLQQAHGMILLDGTRAGLLFAYQHAGGIAMVKDPHTEQWSPVSFVGANEVSQGLQIGGVHSFRVILITRRRLNATVQPKITLCEIIPRAKSQA
jgi:lipid-binding SYLF domain-containing protein